MKHASIIAVIFAMGFAMPLGAKEKTAPAVNADTQDSFTHVAAWVRQEMQEGGRYSYVTWQERKRVNATLDTMASLFQKVPAVAQMSDQQKTEMFNNQGEVNGILTRRDNDRLVCKNEIPVGTHIPLKVCETAGAIHARQISDRGYIERNRMSTRLQQGDGGLIFPPYKPPH